MGGRGLTEASSPYVTLNQSIKCWWPGPRQACADVAAVTPLLAHPSPLDHRRDVHSWQIVKRLAEQADALLDHAHRIGCVAEHQARSLRPLAVPGKGLHFSHPREYAAAARSTSAKSAAKVIMRCSPAAAPWICASGSWLLSALIIASRRRRCLGVPAGGGARDHRTPSGVPAPAEAIRRFQIGVALSRDDSLLVRRRQQHRLRSAAA